MLMCVWTSVFLCAACAHIWVAENVRGLTERERETFCASVQLFSLLHLENEKAAAATAVTQHRPTLSTTAATVRPALSPQCSGCAAHHVSSCLVLHVSLDEQLLSHEIYTHTHILIL